MDLSRNKKIKRIFLILLGTIGLTICLIGLKQTMKPNEFGFLIIGFGGGLGGAMIAFGIFKIIFTKKEN